MIMGTGKLVPCFKLEQAFGEFGQNRPINHVIPFEMISEYSYSWTVCSSEGQMSRQVQRIACSYQDYFMRAR